MQTIFVGNGNIKKRALLVPTNEWKRLKKMLTKANDDKIMEDDVKRFKEERRAASNAIAQTWASTTLNKRNKELENKRKMLADIEARQLKRDEERKLEISERRKMIVDKAHLKKWLERDSTKELTRAVQNTDVLKERAIQISFNETEKAKKLEEERLNRMEQNVKVEQYKENVWQQKLREAETKKANAITFREELRKREDMRREEKCKLDEEGKAELHRIAREIKEDKEKEKTKIRIIKEKMWKNLLENREIVTKKNEIRQMEEQEENVVIGIMAEAKKRIAKTRKLKEIELLKEKRTRVEKMTKKTNQKQVKKENAAEDEMKNAIDEKERRYHEEQSRKNELAKKLKKDIDNDKKMFDEEYRKEKERLLQSRVWEKERRLKETQVLRDLEESNRLAKIEEKNCFRKHLDMQRKNNRAASLADKRVDRKQYDAFIKSWRKENEEFMSHAKDLIEKNKESGKPLIPILKVVKNYKKNNVLLDDATKA